MIEVSSSSHNIYTADAKQEILNLIPFEVVNVFSIIAYPPITLIVGGKLRKKKPPEF